MRIIFFSGLLLWVGCKASTSIFKFSFAPFEIRKIVSQGIQAVEIQASGREWPKLKYKDVEPNLFKANKLKMAVIGDTGCRLTEAKGRGFYQNCNLSNEWPYAQIVQSLIKENYDFAVHTGDYHYREQCTDEKLCPTYSKSVGYGWNAWWDDFYGPSLELFKKSAILFVRGNHEDCNRAYSGWGPLSAYNKEFKSKCEDMEPYQWIEMGDLVLINLDDSAFQDRKPSSDKVKNHWLQMLKEISKRISALAIKKEIWLLTHKPIAGYVPDAKLPEPFAIADYLKTVITESGLINQVDYFLSGHIHNQQLVLEDKKLLQIIVGHSGTALDPFGRKIKNSKMISVTESKDSFGYALFERKGFKHWNLIFKNKMGTTELFCKIKEKKVSCK